MRQTKERQGMTIKRYIEMCEFVRDSYADIDDEMSYQEWEELVEWLKEKLPPEQKSGEAGVDYDD